MAKNPSKTTRKRRKVGVMYVHEEWISGAWKWRADCRKKWVDKGDRRRVFSTEDEAEAFALNQSDIATRRKAKQLEISNPIDREKFILASEKVDTFNTKEWDEENRVLGERGEYWDKLTIERSVDVAISVIRKVQEINSLSDRQNYSVSWVLNEWASVVATDRKRSTRKDFSFAIDSFLREKGSPHGGRGRKALDPQTLNEWKTWVGKHLREWVGTVKLGSREEMRSERKLILDKITANDGWSQGTRAKCASKIQEFGNWLAHPDRKYVTTNPFADFRSEFATNKKKIAITVYTPSEVKTLLKIAMQDDKFSKLIPYLSLIGFAGLRPAEVAKPSKPTRYLSFDQIQWNTTHPETGGVSLFIPEAKSKVSYDRYADLSQAGVSLMQWWSNKYNDGALPTEGDVYYSRRVMDRLKKRWAETGTEWEPDCFRHSFCSYANRHWSKLGVAYWSDKVGNTEDVFRSYYRKPINAEEAQEYFEIRADNL